MKEKMLRWLSVAILASFATANLQGQQAELIAFWDFEQIDADGETIRSADGQWAGVINGDALLTENGGGRPQGGGRGFDVSEANPGFLLLEAEGDDNPLNVAAENDQVSIVFWQKNFSNVNSSSFWSVAEDSDRHIQFHVPWSNGIVYFDSMGCCGAETRLQQAPGEDHEWVEEWHHYAFVKDEGVKRIYVDGSVILEQEGYTPLSTLVTAIYIGSQSNGDQPDGVIDDFAMFKGVLSAEEIQGFAAGDSPGVPPVDTDGDGIPDRWEEQFGLDINDAADAALDPDEDGDDNLAEFTKGTDPNDVTDPVLLSATVDCSLTNISLNFSEKLDVASATDPANYSIEPSLAIEAVSVKKGVVTLTTATQSAATSYTVTANNVIDFSKNVLAANSTAGVFTCTEITEGVLRFAAWNDIGGTAVTALLDDGRYPNDPDFEGPVFSLNSRDIYPGDGNNNFGAVIEGWITPEESGDYDFFLRSDDGSELWISTDDSEGNLTFQAEELGCCNAFQEPGADQTTFNPISLEAGEKYFIQVLYKEGGGGDFAQVAWRLDGDDTPAGDLEPIPGKFLSSAVALLAPSEGSFAGRSPVDGAANVLPTTSVSISHRNGGLLWTADNTSLSINGTEVESAFEHVDGVASLTHTPSGLLASGANDVSLSYPGGTEEWSFSVVNYGGSTLDSVGSYAGVIAGNAVFTEDGGGYSGSAGDHAMDFTSDGGSVMVLDGDFLNAAAANDELTVVYWGRKHAINNSSAFWIASASANSGNRGFQAHVPWGNGQIYFDTQGCCAAGTQRLNGPVADFGGFTDETFWTDSWHLYSFSKKGDVKEIRIDGELFLDGVDADPLSADVTALFIGSDNGLGNNDLSVFDDFAVFSTALSETDLKSIVNGGSAADLGGLIAFWDFNDASSAPAAGGALGDGTSIAINFGSEQPDDAGSDVTGPAGILGTSNWNNLPLQDGDGAALIADVGGSSADTTVTVSWTSNNTWASTGLGEENNTASGDNKNLLTGYLDTNGSDPNSVTVSGLPADATYDVIVYTKGGVIGRGGDYTIGALTLAHNDAGAFDGNFVFGPAGDYLIFPRVSGSSFVLSGQPSSGDPARAPINAIEILIGGGAPVLIPTPPIPGGGAGAITGISRAADGSVSIEFTGSLQSSDTVDGSYSAVAGASSPFAVDSSSGAKYYIAR
jgi:hypothetical protein